MRKIDVACGQAKSEGFIGIDRTDFEGVDIVRDVMRGLPFDDDSVDQIVCRHYLEHNVGSDLIFLIEEFYRVSIPNAHWIIIVPDSTSPNRYRDPTRLTRDWSEDSFIFWEIKEDGEYLIHRGPAYNTQAKLLVEKTELLPGLDRLYQIRVIK